nr:alcohol dehydrogenase [Candidatus Cloacimonadota bacterium]
MESFTFHNPTKILFGKGQIANLGKQMQLDGVHRCILVAGGGSIRKNGAYDAVIDSLQKASIQHSEAWGVVANPRLDKVYEIINLAREYKADAILAVGGGSVIDTSKSVAAGFYLNDIWDAFLQREKISKALPIYTVLTISATGSEMNGTAVITNTKTKQKFGMFSELIYPKLSIIDPTLQETLPFRQTANGAMDAIAHILEFYFADDKALSTIAINEALILTIMQMTDILKSNPKDYVARANLAWCATLALNGISGAGLKGGDWGCHAIEHALSALHPEIAHGEGLAVIFPAWIEYHCEKDPSRFVRWSKKIFGEDNPTLGMRRFRDRLQNWEMPTSLRDLGIKHDELEEILNMIMISDTVGAIYKLKKEELRSLLMLAF